MFEPYEAPRSDSGYVPLRRWSAERCVWLAANLAWALLSTFAIALCAWLLLVLNGWGRGLLY